MKDIVLLINAFYILQDSLKYELLKRSEEELCESH